MRAFIPTPGAAFAAACSLAFLALLALTPATVYGDAGWELTDPGADEPVISPDAFEKAVKAYDQGDFEKAYELWLPLARLDDPAAQRNIAHLYRHGLGVAQSFESAAQWYRRAAELGLASAQVNLATMRARGQGAPQNYEDAAYWYHEAALQGHILAQYNLGLLYAKGLGVKKSETRAIAWLHRAAKGGHRKAVEQIARLVPAYDPDIGPPAGPTPPKAAAKQTPPLKQLKSVHVARLNAPKPAAAAQPNAENSGQPPFWQRMWSYITPFEGTLPSIGLDRSTPDPVYPTAHAKGTPTAHSSGLMTVPDLSASTDQTDLAPPESWPESTTPSDGPPMGVY